MRVRNIVIGTVVVVAVLVAVGSQAGSPAASSAPGANLPPASPTQAPGTIAFDAASYSCKSAADVSFHVVMSQAAGALSVQLVMAKVDASGAETSAGVTPASIAMTGPDVVSFDDGPVPAATLCAGLDPGAYVFRIVSADGSKTLAEGKVTLAP
jgi:hypothetical protein